MGSKKQWWETTHSYWEMNDKQINVEPDEFEEKLDNYYDYKESWMGKIEDWWWDKIGYRIHEFKLGVKSLIRWFPIIWKDREYDDSFAFKILKQKLYHMAQYHIDRQHYVGWEREVERMTLCIKLIDFIVEEHYEDTVLDYLHDKYGNSKFIFTPTEDKNYSSLNIKYDNIENGMYTKEQHDEEHSRMMDEARSKHDKARTLLFKILSRHIEKWWI